MDDNKKILDEIMDLTRKDTFTLINKIDQELKNTKVDITNPLQHIVDLVIDRLLFDGFSPKIIQKILRDSLKWTVDNYADRLKNTIAEITTDTNEKKHALSACNVKIDKKLLN